jgi:glycosyltransferase involved in cell wall biosynthesis
MPVNVLYLTTELAMGGAERALLHLLTNLNRERFTPEVACLYNGDGVVGHAIQELDIPVYDAQMRGKADLGALVRLYNHIRTRPPTILHTSLFHANMPGRIIGSLVGVPIIISSERTMAMENEWRYQLNRWTIGIVDRIVAVSENVGEFCINHIRLPAEKVVVIHNGVEIPSLSPDAKEQARQLLGFPQEMLVCGAVSRLEPVKGISDLISAFTQIREKQNAYLAIIGDGSLREHLESLAQDTGISNRIIWTGYRPDVLQLLPAFDLFIQPSHHEGLPNTVLEAMAAGLPVVATNVGGTPELVVDDKTGLLVHPGDPAGLAKAVSTLLENPERRGIMGRAGQRRVEQHFSVGEMVQKTEQLYEELLTEKSI